MKRWYSLTASVMDEVQISPAPAAGLYDSDDGVTTGPWREFLVRTFSLLA